MAPAAVAVAVAAAALVAQLLPVLVELVLLLLLAVVVDLAHRAHKLPLLLQVAAVRPVPLPQQPEVAALASVLVQGLVASEAPLRSRQSFSAATARISPPPVPALPPRRQLRP